MKNHIDDFIYKEDNTLTEIREEITEIREEIKKARYERDKNFFSRGVAMALTDEDVPVEEIKIRIEKLWKDWGGIKHNE